ncbi:RNA pseudouridylate synthase / RluA [Leishmania donovani]|uniref:ORF C n=2 Tax=Leishmania donovani TaxID=5661 RepID=Q25257_LEIDO|nr:C-terminal sequence of ORF C product shows homology to several bacterial ORFs (accession numbers M87501, M59757, D10483, M62747, M96791, X57620, Z12154) and human EST cDNA (Z13254) [Leishmania donovani]CAJ1993327.1 RNA pseudouridylate synthase / RluA [Leishmania donovani]VDZ49153.1 RNA_pseudouridylate_synthase_putative/Pfam:PF00849 [Leishmania donovani]
MHHVRGLVRHAGRKVLRALEARQTTTLPQACLCRVELVDVNGERQAVTLLHPGALLTMVKGMTPSQALRALEDIAQQLDTPAQTTSAGATSSTKIDEGSSRAVLGTEHAIPQLYVKDQVHGTCTEVQRRQCRFIAKVRGRFVSSDPAAVEGALHGWLQKSPGDLDDVEAAQYNGMVESLAATDTAAAIALAINPSLPSLSAAASAALASLVQLHTPAAVHAFLESFAGKDESATSASDSCATQLAMRLRRELGKAQSNESRPAVSSAGVAAQRPGHGMGALLREATHFSIDPGVVFPAEPASIQAWANQFVSPDMLPVSRAAAVLKQVRQRRLQPRRVAMDSLSVWTLTDLERPWLRFALESSAQAQCARGDTYVSAAYQLALKDPKRNLVDNRLLHTYARALARGDISPLDDSFAAYLEECGECHDTAASERPSIIRFTLSSVPDGVPLLRALHDLAPKCSYWRTLLDHLADSCVRVSTAPMSEVKVEVRLPCVHECVAAATAAEVKLPIIPVLYEDDDVLVVDKPAGLATSRHGLSCTQLGTPTTDLISVLLATDRVGALARGIFRQGQVHRLDAETSGCLLIAKSDVAADSLRHQLGTSAAFSHHSKIYHALCVVLEPSLRNVRLHDDIIDAADPKIRTRYRVIRFFPKHRVAWVECRIQQGKKHQIRRHLASRGLPILADLEHGGAVCCQSMISRVALHAHSLSFIHPVTADPITAAAPLPADFRRCLSLLRDTGVE